MYKIYIQIYFIGKVASFSDVGVRVRYLSA